MSFIAITHYESCNLQANVTSPCDRLNPQTFAFHEIIFRDKSNQEEPHHSCFPWKKKLFVSHYKSTRATTTSPWLVFCVVIWTVLQRQEYPSKFFPPQQQHPSQKYLTKYQETLQLVPLARKQQNPSTGLPSPPSFLTNPKQREKELAKEKYSPS